MNGKGGVGKTTASVNLAAALAAPRRRVLLIDLDSQASASFSLGVPRAALVPSLANCLLNDYPVAQAVRPTSMQNLDLVTGSFELANADLALCDVVGRELTLRNRLVPIQDRYDITILDCPPSMSLVGVNALNAADAVLVPVTPHHLAIEGVISLFASVEQTRTRLKTRATVLGIVLMMVDGSAQTTVARARLHSLYGDLVFQSEIMSARTFNEAAVKGQAVSQFAPRSAATLAFSSFADEVIARLRAV